MLGGRPGSPARAALRQGRQRLELAKENSLNPICRALPRSFGAAARTLLLSALGALALAACSSNYNLGVNPSLGIAVNVSLAVSGGVTQLYPQEATTITATVSEDPTAAGVSWSLIGPGTIVPINKTQAEFYTPLDTPTIVGAESSQITATSVANAAQNSTITIVTLGTPVIPNQVQFPANVNTPYATDIVVRGGTTPFAWSCTSCTTAGVVAPGLTLTDSGTAITTISGTPTTPGTYTFTVQVEDATAEFTTEPITITVNPQSTCLLSGQFTLAFSGFRGGGEAIHLATINVSSTGSISGEQDYKDGHRTTLDETLNATSLCRNRSTNSGYLRLFAPSGELDYNFSASPPDANGVIHTARIQLIGSPDNSAVFEDSGSGEMDLQDTTAITAAAPSGNFAFVLLGVDQNALHYGTAGELSAAGGTFTGVADSNAGPSGAASPLGAAVNDAALSGTWSVPDALGRGTATFQVGTASESLVYYIVNAGRMMLMNADTPLNTAREIGTLTAQSGDVNPTTFDANALASPSILSLWGKLGRIEPVAVNSLGRLFSADPGAGTLSVVLDTANAVTDTDDVLYSGQSYSVDPTGRGTLTLTQGSTTRSFVFYLDAASDGYIIEPASAAGSVGLLEAQTIPAGGTFSDTYDSQFVGGTQWPQADGPVALQPLLQIEYGTLSSDYENGNFAIDPASGRGFGTAVLNGVGETADVLYIVSPTKVDLMNFATPTGIDSSINWLLGQ
jgi:hypothetical protein